MVDVILNGLSLLGNNGRWDHSCEQIDGMGGPALVTAWQPRVARDGEIPSASFHLSPVLTLHGVTEGVDEPAKWAAYDELRGLLPRTSVPLVLRLPQGDRHVLVRREGDWDMDISVARLISWSVTVKAQTGWLAGDGTSAGWIAASTGLPSSGSGGFPVPITSWPWASTAKATSGTITLTNPGDGGLLDIRIDGPVQGPRVEWSQGGDSGWITWPNLSLGAGEWLHWRSGGWPMLMDQAARYPEIGSRLPDLSRGDITFSFSGQSDGTPTLTVSLLPGFGG